MKAHSHQSRIPIVSGRIVILFNGNYFAQFGTNTNLCPMWMGEHEHERFPPGVIIIVQIQTQGAYQTS